MEFVEVECNNCSKKIYVIKERVREKMFCTLGCMDMYSGEKSSNVATAHPTAELRGHSHAVAL